MGWLDNDDDQFAVESRSVEGIIASNPSTVSTLIKVVVPSFADDQALDKLRWVPYVKAVTQPDGVVAQIVMPTAGMSCLVHLTPSGTAWVGAYWPN